MTSAEQQAKPLEGLDAKLATSTTEADRFYERRLPVCAQPVPDGAGRRDEANRGSAESV